MTDPIAQFSDWFAQAKSCAAIPDATAMSLATVDAAGKPSLRIVLLKSHDARGFVFYTNMESRKSRELLANPQAALCFHWAPLARQVRIEGNVERVDDVEADAYFASRPRESQIGAWASRQSALLTRRDELLDAINRMEKKYAGRDVLRPPHWSGWRVVPQRIEFWQQGDFRLHEREVYEKNRDGWVISRLYP